MQAGGTYIEICSNLNRSLFTPGDQTHQENNMVYNSQIISKNSWRVVSHNLSPVNSLIEKLYRASKKAEPNWDTYDVTNVRTITAFIKSKVDKLIALSGDNIASPNALHYVFIVPSHWKESIRQETIRPIFIESDLITVKDHPDRLLFYTDLESVYYNLQKDPVTGNTFKNGQKLVFCRFSAAEKNEILVKLDLIQSEKNNIFDFSNSMLFPKVLNSVSLPFSEKIIKGPLKEFIKRKLFPPDAVNQEKSSLKRRLNHKFQNYEIVDVIVNDIYNGDLPGMDTYNEDYPQNEQWLLERKRWKILYEEQKETLRSIRPIDIYTCAGETFLKAMKDVLSNNLTREYSLFQIDNRYLNNINLDDHILKWLYRILEYNRYVLKCIIMMTRVDIPVNSLDLGEIPKGACHGAFEAIKNSNIYSKPRILDAEISVDSSSTFLDAKVNAIVNIDISLKSTTLSLSYLNGDGLVEEISDHNQLIDEKCLPSLDRFYQVSHETTLTMKKQFVSFADQYLVDYINLLTDTEGNRVRSTASPFFIEKLLSGDPGTDEMSVSTKQKRNNIKKSTWPFKPRPYEYWFLLEGVTGTVNDFKDIIYASGLVSEDDDSTKLRVITQGEGMLPAIQKYLNLELPLKSYFVLAQLHEDHIQLTLNLTVTFPDSKGEQESIIVEDKIIPIKNIYDSFCLNVWRNLEENSDSIQLCNEHTNGVLPVETQEGFEVNLKQYILENIFKENTNLQLNKKVVLQLGKYCTCKFHLLIEDIIEVFFKPVLQEIMYYVSAIDTEEFGFGENNIFPFLKMGDIISSSHSKRILYLKKNFTEKDFVISMKLLKYKTQDNLEYNGTSTLENYVTESVSATQKSFKYSDYKSDKYIPVAISVRSQGHSSSLWFSLNVVGQRIKESESMETGEPLTLRRF
ncbi:hypothetical protein MFLAVUS_002601 [Mucor flavus]|uniref:Uncharacterized protein n=1 Tax=Mucor flavus TaxID=439312 RepID=A0ABP9YQR7_9FUNG